MSRVLLVNMPFSSLRWPALGISLLQAALHREGIDCDIAYFGFDLAETIGLEAYDWVNDSLGFVLGESGSLPDNCTVQTFPMTRVTTAMSSWRPTPTSHSRTGRRSRALTLRLPRSSTVAPGAWTGRATRWLDPQPPFSRPWRPCHWRLGSSKPTLGLSSAWAERTAKGTWARRSLSSSRRSAWSSRARPIPRFPGLRASFLPAGRFGLARGFRREQARRPWSPLASLNQSWT